MGSFAQGALVEQVASVATAGVTTTLTSASLTYQKFTGVLNQIVVLPNATTMKVGRRFQIDSRTTGTLTINYNSGAFATDILAYVGKTLVLVDNSTTNGTWTISVSVDNKEPLKISQAPGVADTRLFISANQVRAEDGTTKTISPLGSLLPSFVETTVDLQTAAIVGGSVTLNGGAFSLPSTTVGQFRRMALVYNGSTNAVDTTFSAASVTQGALTGAGTLFALISGTPLGYVDLVATGATAFKTASSGSNVIENFSIFQVTSSGIPPLATTTLSGLVSTVAQTFAGPKTFNDATTFKASSGTIAAGGYDGAGQWVLGDALTALPVTIKGSGSSNLLTLQAFSSNNGVVELIANVGAANSSIIKLTSGASGSGIIRLGHASAEFKIQNSSSVDLASMAAGGAWTFPISVQTPIVILTAGGASGTTKLTLSGTTWQIGGTVSTITEAGTFSGVIGSFSSSVGTPVLQLTSGGTPGAAKLTLSGTTWQIGGVISTITEAGAFVGVTGSFPTNVGTSVLQLTAGGSSGTTKLTLSGTTWQIGGTTSTITEAGTFSGVIGSFPTSVNTAIIQNTAAAALDIKAASGQAIRFAAGGAAAGAHGDISALGSLTISSTTDHLFNGNLTFPSGKGIESSAASAILNIGTTANPITMNLGTGSNITTVNVGTGAAASTINIGTGAATTINIGTGAAATAINVGGVNDIVNTGAASSSQMHPINGYARIVSPTQSAIAGGGYGFDFSLQHIYYKTGGAGTFTLNNLAEGQTVTLMVASTGASYTITWALPSGSIKWPAALVPNPTSVASRYDVYNFIRIGGAVFGTAGLNFGG